ncbi:MULTISPECIES: SHOCT domain-containing protein [unclassified Haladaptatus]|uniref:SHOCT domain-containing protein n=1 Tax=unclassified Haladaptatus TaxID=2622732 RepID=UPI002FCE328B
MGSTVRARAGKNAAGIASLLVTGIWLAAMFTGQSWWLAAMLFGYIVVVPIVALLFGDDEDGLETWWDDQWNAPSEREQADEPAENKRDALETLRDRYARGELTDEQFERKLERLLDTDTLESAEDRAAVRDRLKE